MGDRGFTRRGLLRTLAAGGLALGAGCLPWARSWPAAGSLRGTLRLAFYTDVHARLEWDTPVALSRAAEAINGARPDLVIAGGDLIADGFESSAETVAPRWRAYVAMHRRITPSPYPAIGNHDLVAAMPEDGTPPSADPRATFRAELGVARTYYSFDALGYHFVVLDAVEVTGDELKYQGRVWPEEMEWLREDLSRVATGMPVIAVTHLPLLTAFYTVTDGATVAAPRNRVVVNSREVLDVFARHRLLLVLQGHMHALELLRWRHTTFITGGAISGQWWRGPWHGTEEGFCILTLRGDRIDLEYVDYGWEARRPASA